MGTPQITSRKNPLIRAAAQLAASAESRQSRREFLCEGARLCEDAARSGLDISTCFFTRSAQAKYGTYLQSVLSCAQEAYLVEDHVASLLSGTKSTQGIFCVCKWPPALMEGVAGLGSVRSCLVLENLQDPGNLGTILRTAEALGVGRVFLLGGCCDPLSPKALRASMGAVFRVAFVQEPSATHLAKLLHAHGFGLHAAVPDSGARKVTEIEFAQGSHAVFIGNEGSGLTPETCALCDDRVTIPMAGRAESLNAAAAATILLWELQRGSRDKEG